MKTITKKWGVIAVLALFVAGAAAPFAASADPSVTIDSVVQRWPWNNKVDITYTIAGGQTRSAGLYCGLRFAMSANGETYNFEGCTIGASAENGQHTATWTAPKDIVSDACTMTATLFTTNVPSGNDYMIVDLSSGDVVYEGLFATQAASNERYTNTVYKTEKLVLRKVPRTADSGDLPNGPFASGYPTGHSGQELNTPTTWTTDRDYYVGVFPTTIYQYEKITGSSPADTVAKRKPKASISWNTLRLAETAATSSIPAVVSADSGTFLQRLNYKTGLYFDLPTEVMSEIAERAGATTAYWWGDTMDPDYVVCKDNSDNTAAEVGSRPPNGWGLYDVAGNVWELCLDGKVQGNLSLRVDAFTPAWATGLTQCRMRCGAGYDANSSDGNFRASGRSQINFESGYLALGFRVSLIAE